ncbi:uncharacterized protein LOC124172329 isoform X1 [Ischnura elegans]|uniref:uncharacterized protein LOC124155793 isoform X1 n=1 Tax=Ischnura elegans TaxID=197161 RepID=UPI001ED86654|nr:uncharacterized protein LOC124155793 isoform X1 [Ischnura elegans]XP_046385847.1 uncharacterized protein LOC124155793 isoform X1 [Ischnura elegans]XP_046407729.1 uncharacterized protein LOC124172329 isoform X1 [Ischnura elegans]
MRVSTFAQPTLVCSFISNIICFFEVLCFYVSTQCYINFSWTTHSYSTGTAGERSVAAQKSCQPKRPSLLKELNIVNNKVEAYEDNHLQMLKEIKEAIHGLQDQQSQLVGETREIAGSLRELVAVNGRIASALEKLTCGSEQ